jgi:hypothetical protein
MPVMAWNEPFEKEKSDSILFGMVQILQERLPTGSSLRAVLHSSARDPALLGGLSPDFLIANPNLLGSSPYYGFSVARQVSALFEKNSDFPLDVDKREVAKKKWLRSEELCAQTNEIFDLYHRGAFQFRPLVDGILYSAQRKIGKVLGDLPPFSELKFRFGPGATTTLPKRNASPRYKLGDVKSCSEGLVNVITDVAKEAPSWFGISDPEDYSFSVTVMPSKVSFVPKNAKTDRAICVEPSLNTFVQLGLGDYISARIRKLTGIDLQDQTRNQRLAREGSLRPGLATLDLSSASDLISRGLVKSLVSDEWFDVFEAFRSRRALLDDEVIEQNKFCSMGNGFTFPLETLIFWALMASCAEVLGFSKDVVRRDVSVYGDDLVVPTHGEDISLYREVLEASGFLLNQEKSFSRGPFRESCGKDYFGGIDVRPVFVKDRLSYAELFRLHNFFHRLLDTELCDYLLSFIPDEIRLYGPDGFGDGHIVVSDPLAFPGVKPHKRNRGWGGYVFDTFSLKGRKGFRPSPGDYVYPGYSIYMTGDQVSENAHTYRKGQLYVDLPGSRGYRRISIYTLTTSL